VQHKGEFRPPSSGVNADLRLHDSQSSPFECYQPKNFEASVERILPSGVNSTQASQSSGYLGAESGAAHHSLNCGATASKGEAALGCQSLPQNKKEADCLNTIRCSNTADAPAYGQAEQAERSRSKKDQQELQHVQLYCAVLLGLLMHHCVALRDAAAPQLELGRVADNIQDGLEFYVKFAALEDESRFRLERVVAELQHTSGI
jgi:hypothetical protein